MKLSIGISGFMEICEKPSKLYRNFRESLGTYFEISICLGVGGRDPDAKEIIKNSRKINGKHQPVENFDDFWEYASFPKLI